MLYVMHKHIIIRVIGEFRERAHCAHKATGVWMMIYMIRLNLVKNINFGLDQKKFFFDTLKNCILGH